MFIADLHIHSKYSRATSKNMNLLEIYKWAQIKGIDVIGTGDFTHPLWFSEIQEKLVPYEDSGLFVLKKEYKDEIDNTLPVKIRRDVFFMLTAEISTIYKKNDRVRKIHSIICSPSIEAVFKLNQKLLDKKANLHSDGRPIIGMDVRMLLEFSLASDEKNLFIPAHLWTPHFAIFGSASGFDSIEEAFEDLSPHIYAVETGLSSDPEMNYMLSKLDKIAFISNSDAHSPQKLAREANIFLCEKNYFEIYEALKTNDYAKFYGTIEFFPEEGKYHLDGHRNCGICFFPEESIKNNLFCPKCSKKLTIGVLHRVFSLADRTKASLPSKMRPFEKLVPLLEIISEVYGMGQGSKKVLAEWENLIHNLGAELYILREIPIKNIELVAHNSLVARAIELVRTGNVKVIPGFDGQYGNVKIDLKRDIVIQKTLF